jgi:hypothetical protein
LTTRLWLTTIEARKVEANARPRCAEVNSRPHLLHSPVSPNLTGRGQSQRRESECAKPETGSRVRCARCVSTSHFDLTTRDSRGAAAAGAPGARGRADITQREGTGAV